MFEVPPPTASDPRQDLSESLPIGRRTDPGTCIGENTGRVKRATEPVSGQEPEIGPRSLAGAGHGTWRVPAASRSP